ncbi:hypothetical protein A3G67_03770 [Candidatus Roizmanbacteria bacterium RIFCSPLOWO2_12_FULL_40_12]|uniref:Sortase n=1 Tax=Candidatus Roizmanbacteria bacterium RIFCSPLOWO2_01_FULL_40_42 TaxID=1802066 RepID=A0A1F7J5Q8_9BACT|nr:MAG: hypothetical protein A2779_03405 [Candidatus Roizmanbacteria bacterium RIFCSPHIGHO2_01_FULL_40_98]OGK28383.1 MAG: hypothetical protein A3C31_00770 [Candidatus Roizmanbacteria bacterium RIFCSPHIGHO2_02_FULL_40_53]OGK30619.1 MAG: hypothetical protein A2W49_03455 [Candidatus Roizmanbacteria bacterium RIFCSPHIGHO2_12_41_18]OGK37033.1 MAG: hypothetical protein A3E69_01030 [Candidatus Roizmanbacteria bacterium RIFCSPHIGHO2_12_FULL_40_130]OGK50939.1 MAG: hypothetical protein A3B50_01540 [Candi
MAKRKLAKVKKIKRVKNTSPTPQILKNLVKSQSKLLLLIGAFLIFTSAFYLFNKTIDQILVEKISGINSCVNNRLSPTNLLIPSQEVSAEIEDSNLIGNVWQISKEKVSHLQSSAVPGQSGNIIMYGHNTKNNFLNLQFLKEGDAIILKTKDNKQYSYVITSTKTVFSTDVQSLKATDEEVLTLYTCVGFGDTMRLVIRAVPAKSALVKSAGKSCRG